MSNSFQKFQVTRRLQSLKNADIKFKQIHSQRKKTMQQTQAQLKPSQGSQHELQNLQQVVKRIKVNALVSQFVYKLHRNTASKPIEYQKIQETLTQKKSTQKYFKSLILNEKLIAVFMIIGIYCILIIQTLSAFQGFYIPYKQDEQRRIAIISLEYFCLAVFFLKILLGIICSQSTNQIKQKYLRYTMKQYLISWLFFFDFLNLIATLFKILYPMSQIAGILCFAVTAFSIPVLSRQFEIVQSVFFNNFRRRQYFAIFKIFMFNIFFAQFVSSIMMAISYWDTSNNWITKAINNGNMAAGLAWWQVYFYSMYWAITTLTTIDYGDLTPANYFEVAFVGLLMLFGTAVLSYNISEISSVISNLRSIDKRRKEEMVIFKRMAQDENISDDLTDKVLDYIQKSAEVRAEFEFDERKKFLDELPNQLKQQFQQQYSSRIFEHIPFFNLLQSGTLVKMSTKLSGQIYYPGQSLTKKQGGLPSIMFLKHGKIGFAYYKPGSTLNGLVLDKRQIKRSDNTPYMLNKYLMTMDREINYQIIAQNYCFILVLENDDFFEVLKQSQKDKEFYFCLYNKVTYIDQEWDRFECKYCAPKRHTVFICPKLHYMPYKSLVIQKTIFGPAIPQQRTPIYRRKQRQKKSPYAHWTQFFKFVDADWSMEYEIYQKSKFKHVRVHVDEQNEKEVKLKDQLGNQEFVSKISFQVLKMHCCELIQKYVSSKEVQIDKMCNFTNFFPQSNPQNLQLVSLKVCPKIRFKINLRY